MARRKKRLSIQPSLPLPETVAAIESELASRVSTLAKRKESVTATIDSFLASYSDGAAVGAKVFAMQQMARELAAEASRISQLTELLTAKRRAAQPESEVYWIQNGPLGGVLPAQGMTRKPGGRRSQA